MTYAYLRVSTDEQDVNSQRQSVEALAKDKNLTIDETICDEGVSGTKQPENRIAQNFGVNKNSVFRILDELGLKKYDFLQKEREAKHQRRRAEIETKYKDSDYCVMNIDRDTMTQLIMQDLTIPEIHSRLKNYTYEQIYDTILVDYEYNKLYRQHGQKKIKKVRN